MTSAILALNLCLLGGTQASDSVWDVVVYGGTASGVTAAVQVARMGRSVVLIEPGSHLGGLTSGGLGMTDTGNRDSIGGLAREFYQRTKAHYDQHEAWEHESPADYEHYRESEDAIWRFEPHVAEQVLREMIQEADVSVVFGERLDRDADLMTQDASITRIQMESGRTFRGRMFVDATYEGDLMAKAGVTYAVGRESNDTYGETLNGIQTRRAVSHQFKFPVSPYRIADDPTSGLLPGVHGDSPGEDGEADHRVQAYCFRMCLTDVPANRVAFPKPDGYEPLRYELQLRHLLAGWNEVFGNHKLMPNRKTDTNNHGAFSTDNIGMNYAYPEGSYEVRESIYQEHETYQKGLMWFLANDPRVPEPVRNDVSQWGLARDEFVDNGNWPHQLYIREARRMVSDVVITENHCRGTEIVEDSVGLASYGMDSHNTQRYIDASGNVRNEGDIQVHGFSPYPISYRAIVPRTGECTNLVVPVCVSASHIAYGSVRMEPVFMILGQSAATAAVLALEQGIPVQSLDYAQLRERLLADGQALEWKGPRRVLVAALDSDKLPGIVVDDVQAVLTGSWSSSRATAPYVDVSYLHDGNESKGTKSARFEIGVPQDGHYELRLSYASHSNRATNVPIDIQHTDGTSRVTVNQRQIPDIDGAFVSLGTYRFSRKQPAIVVIRTDGTDGHVIVDAAQMLVKEE